MGKASLEEIYEWRSTYFNIQRENQDEENVASRRNGISEGKPETPCVVLKW